MGTADLGLANADVPSPEEHLGFRPGADFQLVPWDDVVSYYEQVAEASERVEVVEIGRSTQDRPMIVGIISAAMKKTQWAPVGLMIVGMILYFPRSMNSVRIFSVIFCSMRCCVVRFSSRGMPTT